MLGKVPLCVSTVVHYKTEGNHCTSLLVCSYPINSPFQSISENSSGLILVSTSQCGPDMVTCVKELVEGVSDEWGEGEAHWW